MLHPRRFERQPHARDPVQSSGHEVKSGPVSQLPVNKKLNLTTQMKIDRVDFSTGAAPMASEEVGLERDQSLNQALYDAKLYESFMEELK